MTKKVLYISYDGMTDPLGQSQVLPYVIGLAAEGYQFTLVSFEKNDRFATNGLEIKAICKQNKVNWIPLKFTSSLPILSKIKDLITLRRTVKYLHKKHQFDLVHCRSYVSADMGLWLKKNHSTKFLFDIRGFWVDERVDGGLWNLKNPFYNLLYQYYKTKEIQFFKYADHVVTLTNASIPYITQTQKVDASKISVIPCATDFTLFKEPTTPKKEKAKEELGVSKNKLVISYLGSIGTWYLLDEMLAFYKQLKIQYPDSVFLFITPEQPKPILAKIKTLGMSQDDFIFRRAKRTEVPYIMGASDLSVYFIKQCFSKISSSPTKLGEILAMGIPVITNSGIGDTDTIISKNQNGLVIDNFSDESYISAINRIDALLELDAKGIRDRAAAIYHLDSAVSAYVSSYQQLLG